VDSRAGLDAVVKRKSPSPFRDSNPRSSSPQPNTKKGEVVPVLSQVPHTKNILGSGGIATRILNIVTEWRRVVSFTLPAALLPG
jgi:hypothetical protein